MTRFFLLVTLLCLVLVILIMLWAQPEAATLRHEASRELFPLETSERAWSGMDYDDEVGLYYGSDSNQDD